MKKIAYYVAMVAVLVLSSHHVWADQVKTYVSGFTITGAENKDELKTALQTLLTSRLNNERVLTIESQAGSDLTITGSYVAFGKVFSIDAAARSNTGNVVARAFVQGNSPEELIPAVGKLAKALADTIAKAYPATGATKVDIPATKGAAEIIKKEAEPSEIIRQPTFERRAGASMVGQRIKGAMSGLALGRTLANGERELFIAGPRTIRYYRLGSTMELIGDATLAVNDKILSIDTADLDRDGVPEVYVTVMNGNALVSQVWVPVDKGLKKVADNLPYFLRGIALEGKEKKIYAQQINMDDDFYGDVYELGMAGGKYVLESPMKLPKAANLYNFNSFTDPKGKTLFVVFNSDGYLLVFSPDGEELWRSSDKFGGTELYYQRSDRSTKSTWTSSPFVFLDQRIVVTKEGDIIVPENTGFWVVGNSRSYSKNAIYAFSWNGASFVEKWHTRQSQNYLADFAYDENARGLLLLEVVKKEGLFDKGASAVSTLKID